MLRLAEDPTVKSEWCPPCRLIAPELESFAAERYAVKVVNVDVDANHAVASRYGIRGVQTVALFRDEKPVATSAGAEPWWANEAAPGPRTQGGSAMNAIETFVDLTMGDADAAVRAALADQGFGVLTEVDVAATSIAKIGADRAPLNILGACHPRLAYHPRARRVGELGPAGFEELAGGSDGAPAGRLGQREVNR